MKKTCSSCGKKQTKRNPFVKGKYNKCRRCHAKYMRVWMANNPQHRIKKAAYDKRYRREKPHVKMRNRLKLFGLTVDEYDSMSKAQGGLCAICLKPNKRALAVDHNHVTRLNRGLLCDKHNLGLGYFDDDPALLERAAAYLRRYDGGRR